MIISPLRGAAALFVLAGLLAASPSPAPAQEGRAAQAALIHPGDVIRLQVWREEDLSGDYLVDQNGVVRLPMVGDLDVTRDTQESLRERVTAVLEERLAEPSIQLFVFRRVRILGEVQRPGLYRLDPTLTIRDALADAGGASERGKIGELILRRDGRTVEADLTLDQSVAESPVRSGDELVVPQKSWVARNTAAVVTGISALVGLAAAFLAGGG